MFCERDGDTVSAYATEAILYLQSPDRLYANHYKWVKEELVFHTLGGYQNSSDGGCSCLIIPHYHPNILVFCLFFCLPPLLTPL